MKHLSQLKLFVCGVACVLSALIFTVDAQARVFHEANMTVKLFYSHIDEVDAIELGELRGQLLTSDDMKFSRLTIGGVSYPAVVKYLKVGESEGTVALSMQLSRKSMYLLLTNLAQYAKRSYDRVRALTLVERYFDVENGAVKETTFNVAKCFYGGAWSCHSEYAGYDDDSTSWQFHDDLSPESLHIQFNVLEKGRIRGEPGRKHGGGRRGD